MSALKTALEAAGIIIKSYDAEKARPIRTTEGTLTVGKFAEKLSKALGKQLKNFPEIIDGVQDHSEMEKLLDDYAAEEFDANTGSVIPDELSHLTLNIDMASTDPGLKRFFCTTKEEEFRDPNTSGQYYLGKCSIAPAEAVTFARPVVPKYMPRRPAGVHPETNRVTRLKTNFFNNYVPAEWELWKRRNPKAWNALPAKPPEQIIRIIKHVIPNKEERNYFYAWLYTSMTKRSYVYLVLCGLPGVGKNRLKLLMRSLHGARNAADGKKETFGENQSKFNSQMEESTFIWFDELKYGPDMEPRMKEYQNDYISIEKKGQDTSRSTEIFCSMVISNNHPRDNYLLFNSRKFAPLVLGEKMLTAVMDAKDIEALSDRINDTHPHFDVKLVAQVAKWILEVGPKYLPRWPNLEYQGPKYWELAHTSMSRWQKIAVLALTVQTKQGAFAGWDPQKKAFLWSKVEEGLRRKKEYESKDYRDATTVKAFFETYCNKAGKKVFEVESADGGAIMDFWIKPLQELRKENVTISLNQGGGSELVGLERPLNMSMHQWKKMKEESEAAAKRQKKEEAESKRSKNEDADLL